MAVDNLPFPENLRDSYLGMPDEDELMILNLLIGMNPQVGVIRHQRWRDRAPHSNKLPLDLAVPD